MNSESVNWASLKSPSINLLIGKSSSGKSTRLLEWLIAYPRLHNKDFNKLTIVHGAGQTEFFDTLTSRLPANVQVVRRLELKPEYLTKDVLRSENGNAVLVLGVLRHCVSPFLVYLSSFCRRPTSRAALCQRIVGSSVASAFYRTRASQQHHSLRVTTGVQFPKHASGLSIGKHSSHFAGVSRQ